MAPSPLIRRSAWLALACAVLAAPALAFDTGPHFDITEDVLRAEGFSDNAIRTAQSANFMVDFYEFMRKEMFKKVLDPACRAQVAVVMAYADSLQHFDDLENTGQVARRWDSMLEATEVTAKTMMKAGDMLGLMAVFGASLHNVQDFYAHSNWVDLIGRGTLVPFGSHPTWLSVDRPVREALDVYSVRKPDRDHGDWRGTDVKFALNQDWNGRPGHLDAYRCAWFATRQWVRLFRTFVDDATWKRMQTFDKRAFDPGWDWDHARRISFYGGHWNGNGGPTGLKDAFSSVSAGTSPDLLLAAVLEYMGYGFVQIRGGDLKPCLTRKRTDLRLKIESLLRTWGTGAYHRPIDPRLPSAAPEEISFVRLRVRQVTGIDPDDGRAGGELDWYGRGRIGGQRFWTCLIDEHNRFDFAPPYAPWSLIKAIDTNELVRSLVVRLTTGTADGAGTDDELFLRLSDQHRIEFPYDPDEDDFENGSIYDYSFPIPPGLRVGDITKIRIEKPGNESAWQLGAVAVAVNDRYLYANAGINAWLDDQTRFWQAGDFRPARVAAGSVPIQFDLMELDYQTDDRYDINPRAGAKSLHFDYSLASGQLGGDVAGKPRFVVEGRGDSDRARIEMEIDRIPGSCRK